MASANQRKATFISKKLKFLKNQGDHLINDVGLYVSRIIAAGESWAEGGHNKLEYIELSHMIDTAVDFLCEKCEELAGGSVDVAVNQLPRPSCEQSDLVTQVITGTASSSATSYRQTAAPLASTATASYNQLSVSVQPADETQLKPVLARIAVIEEAMYSSRSNAEKVAEKISDIEQQLKELLSTLSASDKKHSSKFRKVKEQISEISDAQDAIDEEHKTSLQSLERQVQKLCTAQYILKEGMESQAELVEKCAHLPNQLKSVKDNISVLNSRIDRIIDDCSNKSDVREKVTDNRADTVMDNTQTDQVISEGKEQNSTSLRELETRLKTLEADSQRNVEDLMKQAEKGEAHLRILCQMLSDRMTPLEQLRTSLNERASMRDDNINKLFQVIQEVAVMSPRLQQLEMKVSGPGCGFTAYKGFSEGINGMIITQYTIRHSTVGNNFDADSGIFTAPFDGLYVASVSLTLPENNKLNVFVKHQQILGELSTPVCVCRAAVGYTTACSVGVVGLKVGDKLFMSVFGNPKSGNEIWVNFTSFLLRNQHLRTPGKTKATPFPSASVVKSSSSSTSPSGADDTIFLQPVISNIRYQLMYRQTSNP